MTKRRRNKERKKKQLKKAQKKMTQHVPTGATPGVEPQDVVKLHWTQKWLQFSQGFKEFMIGFAIFALIVLGGVLLSQGVEPQAMFETFIQAFVN